MFENLFLPSHLILAGILFTGYFLPSSVAWIRRCRKRAGILLLNLFLGWTFFGWVIALVWAASDEREPLPTRQTLALPEL